MTERHPLSQAGLATTSFARVYINMRPIVPQILGGRVQVVQSSGLFVLNAAGSYDPDNMPGPLEYLWNSSNGSVTFSPSANVAVVIINATNLLMQAPGKEWFSFHIYISKDVRHSSAAVSIKLQEAQVLDVSLSATSDEERMLRKVWATDMLQLESSVARSEIAGELDYSWMISELGTRSCTPCKACSCKTPAVLVDESTLALREPALTLEASPTSLHIGSTYIFALSVFGSDQQASCYQIAHLLVCLLPRRVNCRSSACARDVIAGPDPAGLRADPYHCESASYARQFHCPAK